MQGPNDLGKGGAGVGVGGEEQKRTEDEMLTLKVSSLPVPAELVFLYWYY